MKFACDTNVLVDVLRTPAAEGAFAAFLARFSHVTFLSAVVILELRAGARTIEQARRLAVREGWTAAAHPSLVQDALLAASCRESGVTLITRDRDFDRFRRLLPGWKTTAPWPTHQG